MENFQVGDLVTLAFALVAGRGREIVWRADVITAI